jgi:integrase
MATTPTPGIQINARGERIIDKRHRGVRIAMRLGRVSQDIAEQRLRAEIAHVDVELAAKFKLRPDFADCALRYLAQCEDLRSLEAIRIHVKLLVAHLGQFEAHQIHDATLAPFIAARRASGVSATTINRSLEIVRTILHRAARSFRDKDGRPWLDAVPPLISMLPETRREPYPITWAEQDQLIRELPAHLQVMALFAVNTGLRQENVCGLRWGWEVFVAEIDRSVFVIPAACFKAKRPHVTILNDAAWSIVQAQRGKDEKWVFPLHGRRVGVMNNNAWQHARRRAGLSAVRVHDLRHTFACRLRAQGVCAEDRATLLGHASHTMAGHYASADVGRLLAAANRVLARNETCTVLRVANGAPVETRGELWTSGPTRVPQRRGGLGFVHPSP